MTCCLLNIVANFLEINQVAIKSAKLYIKIQDIDIQETTLFI